MQSNSQIKILYLGITLSFFILHGLVCSFPASANRKTSLVSEDLLHHGVRRDYHVYSPTGRNSYQKKPLVIALHGGGGTGLKFAQATDNGSLTQAADRHGFVVVFPEGLNRQWNDGRRKIYRGWNKWRTAPDDVSFIEALIDTMIDKYGIDPGRVYVTGISNGGFMSIRLALDLSNKITAIAPVTAQISEAVQWREPSEAISIMVVNGTEDPLVPYAGGNIRLFQFGRSRGRILSTDETIDRFVEFNACNSEPSVKKIVDFDPQDGTRVEVHKYGNCTGIHEVVLVKVIGGGHTWPGGVQYLPVKRVGRVSKDINATDMIIKFFLSKSK